MATAEEDTESNNLPNILCFQHCDDGRHISCFRIPDFCACCMESLVTANFVIPPFLLPSPLSFASEESLVHDKLQFSLLIKPTLGNFLTTYKSGDDLHIGVTDSKGKIYSFDEEGVKQSSFWKCCLSVKIARTECNTFASNWDTALFKHVKLLKWQKNLYDDETHNCYSFALEFLNTFLQSNYNKEEFCEKYIIPMTKRAAKYIAIFRKITKDGFFLH